MVDQALVCLLLQNIIHASDAFLLPGVDEIFVDPWSVSLVPLCDRLLVLDGCTVNCCLGRDILSSLGLVVNLHILGWCAVISL